MITLICGLPRAGKTTYSQQFDNVIHLDTCGAYNRVKRKVKHIDDDIVVDGVYNERKQRVSLIEAYAGNGARCIWMDTPQVVRSSRHGWDKYCDFQFDEPSFDEGWDEIVIIRGDNDVERYSRQTEN
jgi:tRNA uridine 5-carbamoylmethylation protein Kti12